MQRKRHSAEVKAKVALEAIKGQKTVNEIKSRIAVHPTQIVQWKKQVLEELPEIFSSRRQKGVLWQQGPVHELVRTWIREHNSLVKAEGKGVRILPLFLPKQSRLS